MTIEEMPKHQHYGFGEATESRPYSVSGANQMGSKSDIDCDNYLYGTAFAGGDQPFKVMQPS